MRLVSEDLTQREVRLAYWRSRMIVVDEVKRRQKFMTISWVEFLEALVRLSSMMTLPSNDILLSLRCANILEYDKKLELAPKHVLDEVRERLEAEREATPLAERVDQLCKLILGRLAIKFHGAIYTGTKRLGMTPTYCTQEQLRDLSV